MQEASEGRDSMATVSMFKINPYKNNDIPEVLIWKTNKNYASYRKKYECIKNGCTKELASEK